MRTLFLTTFAAAVGLAAPGAHAAIPCPVDGPCVDPPAVSRIHCDSACGGMMPYLPVQPPVPASPAPTPPVNDVPGPLPLPLPPAPPVDTQPVAPVVPVPVPPVAAAPVAPGPVEVPPPAEPLVPLKIVVQPTTVVLHPHVVVVRGTATGDGVVTVLLTRAGAKPVAVPLHVSDGSFIASARISLKPGVYTLSVGAVRVHKLVLAKPKVS
jgi:hypothetical protein